MRLYDRDDIPDMLEEVRQYLAEHGPMFQRKDTGNGGKGDPTKHRRRDGPLDLKAEFGELNDTGSNMNAIQCSVIGTMLSSGTEYDAIAADATEAAMEAAEERGLKDRHGRPWTKEVERGCVRDRIVNLFNDRCQKVALDELNPAPPWVQDNLADRFEEIVKSGRQPKLVDRYDLGWYLRSKPGPNETGEGEGATAEDTATASNPAWPTPYSARPASAIPTRKRLHGAHYTRGSVTLTAAPGGTGKSQFSLVEAVGMAAGYNLVADEPCERLRVWVWNAEDDVDEMERRICGICDHYGVDRESIKEWLFLDSGETVPLEFAVDNGRIAIRDSAVTTVANRVRELALDVIIFDPLVAIHALQEGDNPSLAKVIRALRNKVAKGCNCAIELVHHTRKPSKESSNSLTADDIRGASSIVYSVRSARILSPMMPTEAEKYVVEGENRHRYFRVELAKSNTARRGTLHWIELIERPIANGEGGAYGDTVTVCAVWTPPDLTAQVSDVFAAAIRSEVAKGEFRRDRRAGSSWAGLLVGQRMGLDMEKPSHRRQATDVLNWLIKKGVLTTEFRTDKSRKSREFIIPGSQT
jgi:hypothetical protein